MRMTGGRPRGPEGCKVGALMGLMLALVSLAMGGGAHRSTKAKEGCI